MIQRAIAAALLAGLAATAGAETLDQARGLAAGKSGNIVFDGNLTKLAAEESAVSAAGTGAKAAPTPAKASSRAAGASASVPAPSKNGGFHLPPLKSGENMIKGAALMGIVGITAGALLGGASGFGIGFVAGMAVGAALGYMLS